VWIRIAVVAVRRRDGPIVVDGHVVEPEGDANEPALAGTLDPLSTG
jgi:hypothetical protein